MKKVFCVVKKVPKVLTIERKEQKSEQKNCLYFAMFWDSVSLKWKIFFYGFWFNGFFWPPPPQKKNCGTPFKNPTKQIWGEGGLSPPKIYWDPNPKSLFGDPAKKGFFWEAHPSKKLFGDPHPPNKKFGDHTKKKLGGDPPPKKKSFWGDPLNDRNFVSTAISTFWQ